MEANGIDKSDIGRTNAERVAFLSRLAGGLAHEIKNPLSTMAINMALLEEDWQRAAAARDPERSEPTSRERRSLKRIRILQREVGRLEGILDEFLNYARVAKLNRVPTDLAPVVAELLEFVEPENTRAGIRQHADLQAGLPLVMVDEGPLRQALLNLFVNARQAMPEGGELLVRVARHGNHAELSVTDTGEGMRPEALEKCFDVFWSDKKGGSGLGLATAKRIVEEHGGSLTVISEEHCGTSFTIYLPLAVDLTHSGRAEPRLDLRTAEERERSGRESPGRESPGRDSPGSPPTGREA